MNDIRYLESKFKDEIEYHLNRALPNISKTFCTYRPSSEYEDGNLCYDLVYNLNFTVSIRIRKYKYIKFRDLTIRYKSAKGYKTEVDKIREGLAQIYFYAYMDELEQRLVKIRVANVDSIRNLINSNTYTHKVNYDGTEFIAFAFDDILKEGGNIYQFDQTYNQNT